MPSFDAQNTDRENSKAAPKSVDRTNDRSVSTSTTKEEAEADRRDTTDGRRSGYDPVTT
jgi:hypothetical protein